MKLLFAFPLVALATAALAQGHDIKPADAMKDLSFMAGDWTGPVKFNNPGTPITGTTTSKIHEAIGGRYLEEMLSTTIPGRKPSDTRHFITFDPKDQKYKAWWFNDSSVGAMELAGELTGNKLVLLSKPTPMGAGPASVLRATYEKESDSSLGYTLELQDGSEWRLLFHTTFSKKSGPRSQ